MHIDDIRLSKRRNPMPSLNHVAYVSLVLLLFSLLFALSARGQQTGSDTVQVKVPELRQELLAMRNADQDMRAELVELIQASEGQPDMQRFMRLKARLDSLDEANAKRVDALIRKHGWPGPALVGTDGTEAAFLIIQHADLAFQKEALPLVRKAYQRGELDGQSLALLTDRVRVGEGKPQRYGTQANIQNGEITLQPIEDSTQVDERRAQLGMPPLSEYIEQLKATYTKPEGGN